MHRMLPCSCLLNSTWLVFFTFCSMGRVVLTPKHGLYAAVDVLVLWTSWTWTVCLCVVGEQVWQWVRLQHTSRWPRQVRQQQRPPVIIHHSRLSTILLHVFNWHLTLSSITTLHSHRTCTNAVLLYTCFRRLTNCYFKMGINMIIITLNI